MQVVEREDNKIVKEVDTRGMFCPTPLIFVSKELKNIPVGKRLKALADDKAFKKDIKIWCHDTGNKLVSLEEKDGVITAVIERGKGWHGDTLFEKLRFYAIGVKLHLYDYFFRIFKSAGPKYIITFMSIPEGFRAIEFLEKRGITDFVTLPVPDEIYEFCGVVIGFKDKNRAVEIYNLLKENKFGVENIHIVDRNRKYPVLKDF
ncbi:TusA-related sulfurtransferase [Persephonella hydrogeniphila]|uniref:TusA-related sulfurtransferase n=1 Tax=Persephonella hydrogeniphila TaxID=198703 RepID=A0A285NQR0_9AQUI|nr:sulfurtransferase TusA family protein [Persephonella hydrogeniphila]SNZ09961.1 TusA-related sulfurtransferase [Persephonella hydrogeniphila]